MRVRKQSVSPFAVINRNTMIDREQNSYKAGIEYGYIFGLDGNGATKTNYLTSTVQYLRNKTDSDHSILATGNFTLVRSSFDAPQRVVLNTYRSIQGSAFYYRLEPTAGLELQDVFQSAKGAQGAQARLYGNMVAKLEWRQPSRNMRKEKVKDHNQWPSFLELALDYTARYSFINTVAGSDRYLPLFEPSLTYFPTVNKDLSLAISYNDGGDPIAGLARQKFWLLAVQFKL
jgi:hypothetical protein